MCHPEAEHDALLLYMLQMRGEGSAPLFFRAADQPSKPWIVLQCSGADPSGSQKPCRNTFQFAWLAFRMARHGMRWIVNCDLCSGIWLSDDQCTNLGRAQKRSPHIYAACNHHWNMSFRSLPSWFLAFRGASPNVRWMNLSMETSSI